MGKTKGRFTLPGESGYEALTLELAERWGADVIRDSDGTELSDEIKMAGYDIYSTVCVIRDHNMWAKENKDKLQQAFLKTESKMATEDSLKIYLLEDYFSEQFEVNASEESKAYWQVFDRTNNTEVDVANWFYDEKEGCIIIKSPLKWHYYSVNFLAYRIWEEISMYNHVTNDWNKEHLMQIDPRYPEVQDYLLKWMRKWCEEHKDTNVVRFTSMFYNFVWIWGSDVRKRNHFTDWGSYDFTVSTLALQEFEKQYGYPMTSEDFINQGKLNVSHVPANHKKKDWMEFTNEFVISFGRKMIDIVHEYGKKAYVFYDDSWVGIEPYNGRFEEFGFDGIIKCVFNGYEVRLCAGVPAQTHEIRLHPYLFPTGLGGAPTFSEGGNPTADAKLYWSRVRRALLREKVDRIGLGGYLHLLEGYPEFIDYIENLSDEFREIIRLHEEENVYTEKVKVAVLHTWGKLRSWTLSGHFHETDKLDLIHINEALSGFPVDVAFIDFQDVKEGNITEYQVIINAGTEESAWSGGVAWDEEVVEKLTEWTWNGGTFVGVNEPAAVSGYEHRIRMAHVLGVDIDRGERICHGKWMFNVESNNQIIEEGISFNGKEQIYLSDKKALVFATDSNGLPTVVSNKFGKGKGIYFSEFKTTPENNRVLYNVLRSAAKEPFLCVSDNCTVECHWFSKASKVVVVNNSEHMQEAKVKTPKGELNVVLAGLECLMKTM